MSRVLGQNDPIRVIVADDSGLIFSDDYRSGWVNGFAATGCEVHISDISKLRSVAYLQRGPYSIGSARGYPKMIAQQIAKMNPDLVFCHHGRAASNPSFLSELHKNRIKTAVYLCDEPYEVGETVKYSPGFRFVFTMDPHTIHAHKKARDHKPGVFYLPPGVDTDHFRYRPYTNRDGPECFFLGNPNLTPRPAWLKMIERVVDGADIRFWKSLPKNHPDWVRLDQHPKLFGNCLIGLNVYRDPTISFDCFKKRVVSRPSKSVPKGLELCKIKPKREGTGFWNDFNLPASHVNPRFLEMSACGTLVVSDDKRSEHRRMFPMAPVAESPEHYLELVLYYLEHLNEAQEIGYACSSLISKRHSYHHRAEEVLIRVGLRELAPENLPSSWAEPEDWLSPQDFTELGERLSLEQIGRSERWSPAYGRSWTRGSGSPREATSIDVPPPWPCS